MCSIECKLNWIFFKSLLISTHIAPIFRDHFIHKGFTIFFFDVIPHHWENNIRVIILVYTFNIPPEKNCDNCENSTTDYSNCLKLVDWLPIFFQEIFFYSGKAKGFLFKNINFELNFIASIISFSFNVLTRNRKRTCRCAFIL